MNQKKVANLALVVSLWIIPYTLASATTLEEAIHQALNTNPDVRVETNELLSRAEEVEQAKAGYLPTVDITAGMGYERSDNNTTRSAGNGHRDLTRKEAAINLQQMLFDGFETESEVARQRARQASASYRLAGVSQNTALETINAYLTVLQQQELLRLSGENLESHKRIYEQVKLQSEAGIGRSSDLEQVLGRRASADASRLADLANLKDAESNYLTLVGELPDALEPVQPPKSLLPASLEEAITVALAEHPTLRSAQADVRSAIAQKAAAKNSDYPHFDLEIGSRWGEDQDGVSGVDKDVTAMVRMRYNLFAGGRNKARQKQTIHLVDEAKEVRNRTYRQVVESLRLSWTAYEATEAQLVPLSQHLVSSENSRDAYIKQFNIGKRTLIDLLNTENEVFEAKRSYVQAQTDFIHAQYRILVGMGQLLPLLDLDVPRGPGSGDEGLKPYAEIAPKPVLASDFIVDRPENDEPTKSGASMDGEQKNN